MPRKVFTIKKESKAVEVKFKGVESWTFLTGTSEYGFTSEIGTEDYEVGEANGAIQHQQTTWDAKFDFKTQGYKNDPLQMYLAEVANGTAFGDDNTIDIRITNYVTGKVETYEDCLISDVTRINGKVNELASTTWAAQANGFPTISEVAEG